MNRFHWGPGALFVGVVTVLSCVFFVSNLVVAKDDGRTGVVLSAGEKELVLAEMRGFLESVQAITMGVVNKDMKSVYASAHKVGMIGAAEVPKSLMAKLPPEFKKLGAMTHKAFDELALEAQDIGDPQIVLSKLGSLMNNCITCHASYRLDVEGK